MITKQFIKMEYYYRSDYSKHQSGQSFFNFWNNDFDQSVKGLLGMPVVKLPGGEEVRFGSSRTGDI
ncbi:hypothetical protein [Paenibacillus sp.]|uniref:hypothetical protein n=1 Tax=Paenibacillus sp. TaxID=58172 RepID=UPI0028A8EC5A|nr:hypothetical protein [Paenibacillus sp.]